MAFDLATAKILLKISAGDTSKDAIIIDAVEKVLALVEKKLGRGILLKTVSETYYDVDQKDIRVYRYPIKTLLTVNGAPITNLNNYRIHHRVGRITALMGWGSTDKLVIQYSGGLDPLPLDLEQALWEILNTYWSTVDPATGLPTGGGGASTVQGSGDVSSVSFGPFGSVRYDVGVTTVGGSSSGANVSANDQRYWGWLSPWIYILEAYRSESAPSICFA